VVGISVRNVYIFISSICIYGIQNAKDIQINTYAKMLTASIIIVFFFLFLIILNAVHFGPTHCSCGGGRCKKKRKRRGRRQKEEEEKRSMIYHFF
jgi:hypothetical protein